MIIIFCSPYILIYLYSEEATKKQLPHHPFAVLQHHGNLYDDPAVVHVIDHSRHHRHHGTNHVRNHGHISKIVIQTLFTDLSIFIYSNNNNH